ncbi:hypothetical protein KFK09_027782 [Dendrobium nobile]|uniref:Uncharacterized protein n=1 Tax=Dendrobium nobile TaxID=94219 RepID=A0A8T3A1M8_DENNO|nr:hypothetical protein KFK09_027782 [Dendrobium nobile]
MDLIFSKEGAIYIEIFTFFKLKHKGECKFHIVKALRHILKFLCSSNGFILGCLQLGDFSLSSNINVLMLC